MKHIKQSGYDGLASKIILMAYADALRAKRRYLKAKKRFQLSYEKGEDDEGLYNEMKRAKRSYEHEKSWFYSDWFNTLANGNLNADAIIERLEGQK